MTETTATAENFDIKVEDAGPARKRISVTIPAETVADRIQTQIGTLQSQAVLPGFRKGKAPKHLIQRRFGTAMQDETMQNLVREGYESAVQDNNLTILGEADVDGGIENLKIEEGKPFSYSVEVDILPEFDLPDFSGFEIIRPLLEVDDEHIDAEIERQCMRAGKADRIESNFEPMDRMLGAISVEAEGEDEPIFTHDQALVALPPEGEAGQVLGLLLDDLNSSFNSAKVGDVVTMTTTGPDGHEREEFRGKNLKINYTIHLAERITPNTPEGLIEQFNLGSEEVLQEQIRLALEQRRDEEQASVLRQQALEKINEAIDIELPEKYSTQQIQRELDRMRQQMMTGGEMTPDEVEIKLAELRNEAEVGMRERTKSFFILQRLAMEFEIHVNESEINTRIADIAMQRGLRPDHVRSELAKAGQLPTIGGQVRDDKAADAVVAKMTIKEMPAEEWNAMHADGGSSKPAAKKKTSKKTTSKKTSTKKASSKKASTKKASSKKASTKKASTKKASTKKASTKKATKKKDS